MGVPAAAASDGTPAIAGSGGGAAGDPPHGTHFSPMMPCSSPIGLLTGSPPATAIETVSKPDASDTARTTTGSPATLSSPALAPEPLDEVRMPIITFSGLRVANAASVLSATSPSSPLADIGILRDDADSLDEPGGMSKYLSPEHLTILPSNLFLDAIGAVASIAAGIGSTAGVPAGSTVSDSTRSVPLSVAIIAEKLKLDELSQEEAEHKHCRGQRQTVKRQRRGVSV